MNVLLCLASLLKVAACWVWQVEHVSLWLVTRLQAVMAPGGAHAVGGYSMRQHGLTQVESALRPHTACAHVCVLQAVLRRSLQVLAPCLSLRVRIDHAACFYVLRQMPCVLGVMGVADLGVRAALNDGDRRLQWC